MTDNATPRTESRLKLLLSDYPWVLRVTELKGKPAPVLVVKQRLIPCEPSGAESLPRVSRSVLRERGTIYGQSLRRCLPIFRSMLGRVCDPAGIPLDLHRLLANGRIEFRGNLPLDEETGTKIALISKLQERVLDMDRIELIALRVDQFTREEAVYWLARITHYGSVASRWACAGMRIILGGQPGDKAVAEMLRELRG
jgi:hypothetical protein